MKTPKKFKETMHFSHRRGRKVQVCFTGEPGRWRSTGTDDEYAAVEIAQQMYREVTGISLKRNQTLREFAEGFYIPGRYHIREMLEKKNRARSYAWYKLQQGRIDNYILPHFGKMLLPSITVRMIDNWIVDLRSIQYRRPAGSRKNQYKPLSSSTKIKILTAFSEIFQEAIAQGIITVNPIEQMVPITERNAPRQHFTQKEIQSLFPQDTDALMKIWGELDWAVYFLIMTETGLRPGEVSALKWENYFPDYKGFAVYQSYESPAKQLKGIKTEKKGKRVKAAFVSDRCASLLKRIRHDKLNGLVFTIDFKPIQLATSLKHFKLSLERSEVKRGNRTQYALRHTFNTLALNSLPEESVQDLMGHTGYRREYDHRTGRDLLEKHKDIRDTMFLKMWS